MRVVLLAAGLGTRLRPITDSVPKCLVPIHGKALLGYWLDLLLPSYAEKILINLHYLPEVVCEYLQASPWASKVETVLEPELLGTGGTLLQNRKFLQNQTFMVAHADNLTRFDVGAFIARHQQRPADVAITMMTFDTDTPHSCGIVEEDAAGRVIAFHEKVKHPPGTRANAAVYIFEAEVLDFMQSLGKPFVDVSTEVLPHFLGRMQCFHNTDYHRDIGTPESLARAHQEFRPVVA